MFFFFFGGNCFKEIIYLPEGMFKELLMLITSQLKKKEEICMMVKRGITSSNGEPLTARGGVPGVF